MDTETDGSPEEKIAVRRGPPVATAGSSTPETLPESSSLDVPASDVPTVSAAPFPVDQSAVLDEVPLDKLEEDPPEPPKHGPSVQRIIGMGLLAVGVTAAILLGLRVEASKSKTLNASPVNASQRFKTQTTSLATLGNQLTGKTQAPVGTVTVNGKLKVNDALILQPSTGNEPAVTGQIYYDQTTNSVAYYNGTGTVHLQGGGNVTNITNVAGNTYNSFITEAAGGGQSINGTPGTLAAFAAGGTLADSIISQSGGNTVVLGNDGGTPHDVTVRGGAGVGSNVSGANMTIGASNGTGSATSGSIIFQTGVSAENGIEFDAAAATKGSYGSGDINEDFTVGTQSNRVLIVSDDCGANSVTYDGRPLTLLGTQNGGGHVGSAAYIEMWYLLAPPSGNHVLDAAFNSLPDLGSCEGAGGGTLAAASYYNVDQTNPFHGTYASTTGVVGTATGTTSLTVSTSSPSQVVVDSLVTNLSVQGCTSAISSGQTLRWTDSIFKYTCGSDQAATGSSMQISYNLATADWSDMAVVLNPVVAQSVPLFIASATTPDALYNRLDITAGGNVGIDNSTPQYALDVNGTANASTAVYTPVLDTESPGTLTVGQFNATNIQLGGVNTGTITLGSGGDSTPNIPTIQGAAAVGNNIIGANMIVDAGNGTGVGGGGDIVFNTAGGVSNPQVTLDTESDSREAPIGGPLTWTHTTGTEADRVLFVTIDTSSSDDQVAATTTNVSYGGVPLTQLDSLSGGPAAGSVWYLPNPPSGAATVSISFTGDTANSSAEASATTFYNVDSNSPIAGEISHGVYDTSISTTLSGTDTGEGIFDAAMARGSGYLVPGSGQTEIYGDDYYGINVTSFRQGQAGSTSTSWTTSSGSTDNINQFIVALSPEPNLTPDPLSEAFRITQSGTLGVDLTNDESAQDTISFGGDADRSIAINQNPGTGNGHNLTLEAGGGAVGNNDGGNLTLRGGIGTGSGIGGGVVVAPQTDSTAAFQVQKANGTPLLTVDSVNSAFVLGASGGAPTIPIVQGAAAVGDNIIGANMLFDAGNGTGVGGSGDIVFDTATGISDPQVTLDAISDDEEQASSNNAPLTWVHTTGAEADRVLIVSAGFEAPITPVTVAQGTVTSVTYDGLPLTQLTGVIPTLGESSGSVWYLINPPSGSHNVSVAFAGPASNNAVEATTFYNVDQTNPIANFIGNNNPDGSSISTSLIGTNPGELIFDSLMSRPDLGQITQGLGQTIAYNLGGAGFADKGSVKQGQSGSTTMSWSGVGSSTLVDILLALSPEPNVTPDTLSEALRITQGGTVGIDLAPGENAQSSITFGGSADRSIAVNQNPGTGNGHNLTLSAGGGAVGSNNGGNLVLQGGQATGTGITGAVSVLTGNAANTTGAFTVQTGNSSTTSAGNINLDTGSSIINGTTVSSNTFETTTENYGAHNGGVAQTTAQAHSGSGSLAFTQGVGGTWDIYQQDQFAVTPGHHYNVTAWVRGGANPSTISSAMVWVGPGTNSSLANVNESGSSWTEISGTVTAPAGATAAYMDFAGTWENAGFVHYLDDVTVIDMSSSSTQALVSIGGTNAQAVTLGNANEIEATNIYGGSGINLNSGIGNIMMTSGSFIARAAVDSATAFQIQATSGASLFTADTSGMNITISGSLIVTGNITVDGHIVTGGSTPNVAPGTAACTSPTVTIAGDDTSGTITVTTGTGCASSGDLAAVTFNTAFGSTPHITLTPIGGNSAGLNAFLDGSSLSTTGFSIGTGTTPSSTATYEWDYWVVQ